MRAARYSSMRWHKQQHGDLCLHSPRVGLVLDHAIRTYQERMSMARETCPAMLIIPSSPARNSANSPTRMPACGSPARNSANSATRMPACGDYRATAPPDRPTGVGKTCQHSRNPYVRERRANSDEPSCNSRVLFWDVLLAGFASQPETL